MTLPHYLTDKQFKWLLFKAFSYHYICQVPPQFQDDETYCRDRDALIAIIGADIRKTDWNTIFGKWSDLRPIVEARAAAKECYEHWPSEEYLRLQGYIDRVIHEAECG